jgi:uncharacterized protein GlcG (DUF336 family)
MSDAAHARDMRDLPKNDDHTIMQTFLRPVGWRNSLGGKRLAKIIRRDDEGGLTSSSPTKEEFPAIFVAVSKPIPSDPMDVVAFFAEADRKGWIPVHGELSQNYDGRAVRRTELNKEYFLDTPGWWLQLDIENLPRWERGGKPVDLRTVDEMRVVEHVRQMLPPELRADAIGCLSGSFGVDPSEGPRLHFITRLDRPLTHAQREALIGEIATVEAKTAKLKLGICDASVLGPGMLFFGAPECAEGCDPRDGRDRWFWAPGDARVVAVPDDFELSRRAARLAQRREDVKAMARAATGAGSSIAPRINREGHTGVVDIDGGAEWGGAWATHLWVCEQSGGAGLWPAMQSATGAFIVKYGLRSGAAEFFCGFMHEWLDRAIAPHRDKDRLDKAHEEVEAGYSAIFALDEWRRVPRVEDNHTPKPYSLEEAEVLVQAEVSHVIAETVGTARREARWRLAAQIVEDGCARVNVLRQEAAEAGASDLGRERRAAADALERRVEKYGRRTGVIVDAQEPDPDEARNWDILTEPPMPRGIGARLWKFEVGLGKTESAIEICLQLAENEILRGSGETLRAAYIGGTGPLCEEFGARVEAKNHPHAIVAHWRGEARPHPTRRETTCPKSAERTAIRLAGGDASARCGSERRGYCQRHPEEADRHDLPPCLYRTQRADVAHANVVTFAGAGLLADAPVRYARRGSISVRRYDWVQQRRRVVAVDGMPAFDMIFIDDAPLSQLQDIEADASTGNRSVIERTLTEMRDFAAGPSPLISDYDPELPVEDQPSDHAKAVAEHLPSIRAIIATLAGRLETIVEGEFLPYGAIYDAIGRDRGDYLRIVRKLHRSIWGLKLPMPLDPTADARTFLGTQMGRELAQWNGAVVWFERLLDATGQALERHANAPDDDLTGYLRAASVFVGRTPEDRIRREEGLAVRAVSKIHGGWIPNRTTTTILDATAQPAVLEAYGVAPDATVSIPVATKDGVAHVTVCRDNTFSYTWMRKAIAAAKAGTTANVGRKMGEAIRNIANWAAIGAAQAGDRGSLLICPLLLKNALIDYWNGNGGIPHGLSLAHFNGLRGLDGWKDAAWLGVISRPLASVQAVASEHALLDGRPDPQLLIADRYGRKAGVYLQAENPDKVWTLRDAQPFIPWNALAEALRAAGVDNELVQAVGRLRLIRRDGKSPVRIEILTNHPIAGLPVNVMASADEMLAPTYDPATVAWSRGILVDPSSKGASAVLAKITDLSVGRVKHLNSDAAPSTPKGWPGSEGFPVTIRKTGGRYSVPASIRAASEQEALAVIGGVLGEGWDVEAVRPKRRRKARK